jgi:hypothetical protein
MRKKWMSSTGVSRRVGHTIEVLVDDLLEARFARLGAEETTSCTSEPCEH